MLVALQDRLPRYPLPARDLLDAVKLASSTQACEGRLGSVGYILLENSNDTLRGPQS